VSPEGGIAFMLLSSPPMPAARGPRRFHARARMAILRDSFVDVLAVRKSWLFDGRRFRDPVVQPARTIPRVFRQDHRKRTISPRLAALPGRARDRRSTVLN